MAIQRGDGTSVSAKDRPQSEDPPPGLAWPQSLRMKKKTIRDIDFTGKRVLLRVDYNVQFENGKILDDLRLRESITTIWALQGAGAKVIILSHRGRPGGEVVPELRNAPVAEHLAGLLDQPVHTVDDCVGPDVEAAVEHMEPGDVLLLENVRFHPEELTNDPEFARQLARLADVYVSDAFGTAHRGHTSIVGVAEHLPAVAGLLLEREVDYLARVLGGAKIADKLTILDNLCDSANVICVGGGIANTFLKAKGIHVGASLVENDRIEDALHVIHKADARDDLELVLPTDVVIAGGLGENVRTVPVDRVPPDWRILDIGPETVEAFREALAPCRTAIWNGPMGLFEREPFDRGSIEVARVLADLRATTVIGGGETAAAVDRAGVSERVSHVSTGGGASLAMLEGRPLPGVEALLDAD
jgi:phosphoglycerate kinase